MEKSKKDELDKIHRMDALTPLDAKMITETEKKTIASLFFG